MALLLWRIQEQARAAGVTDYFGSPGVPPLDSTREPDGRPRLERLWDEAEYEVRLQLVRRAGRHLSRAGRGSVVLALRMNSDSQRGARIVPEFPGLYYDDRPTTIGLRGEATLEEARDLVASHPAFEIVQLGQQDLREVQERLRHAVPDEAAVAEAVAGCYSREQTPAAERYMRRLRTEAENWEYRHLTSEHVTGRRKLPPPRTYHCPVCGSAFTVRRHGVYCSRASKRWGEKP